MPPRRKPQPPSSKKPDRRSPRKSAVAMPDPADLLPSAAAAAASPDPEMPPRRSLAGGGNSKLRKPLTGKLRAAAEERLARLRHNFRLRPLDHPPPSLTAAPEAALRALGLLDFARLSPHLRSAPARPDLVARLVAYYDQTQHRSFVRDTRVGVSRSELSKALALPPKAHAAAAAASPPEDVDPAALAAAAQEFMRAYVLAPFNGGEACILPPEVAAAQQAVRDGSAHRVDWGGLIWGLVEKEILELPRRDDRVCYFGPYLQRLILAQKPDLLELPVEEGKGEAAALVVSLDEDEDDGDADVGGQSSDQLEPRDADAAVRSNLVEASEIEGASSNLDELKSDEADADTSSKISEEPEIKGESLSSKISEEPEMKGESLSSKVAEKPEIKGESLRGNDSDVLEPGDADGDTKGKVLEESNIEGAPLRSNNLDELESGNPDADMSSKEILEESKLEGAPLSGNNLDELESGNADADMSSKEILEESKVEGEPLRSNSLDELESGNADADMSSKEILEESNVEGAPLSGNNLDVLELGDADDEMRSNTLEEPETEVACVRSSNLDELESGDVDLRSKSMDDLELGDVDANARGKISDASMVADENAEGMNLDEPKVGDENADSMNLDEQKVGGEFGLGLVPPEPLAVIHQARTSNDDVPGDMLSEGDEGVSVSAAQEDGSQSTELVLTTQEEVLAVPEEDEEAECEAEEGIAGWNMGTSSANDDGSMDAEENASVEDLSDSDNVEGEEIEQDGFERYRGGVEMGWRMEDENGGEETTNCFPGMQFQNLNKEGVMSFDDGFSGKLGSLPGIESTNLLQSMNSIPAPYNGTENAHDLTSGDFLAMGADAHKNGLDLGTGSSFFFGNNGKRHIGDIDGYNDQMEAEQQFLQGNQQKRARNCNSSVPSGSAFFKANFSDPMHNLLLKASISYEQKERENQELVSQKQYLANLLQDKDTIIQSLNSARFEQENKYQEKLRCFEHDLNLMGQLVSGYKKALKQSQASFSEYRKKFPSNKFRYHDVPNSGGLVVSVNELERKRKEEEQQILVAAKEMIEEFDLEWVSKFEDWTKSITFGCSKIEELAREIDLLKKKREAKVATLATEE